MIISIFCLAVLSGPQAYAAIPRSATALPSAQPRSLSEKLTLIRKQSLVVERSLVAGLHGKKEAQENIRKIKTLIQLQNEEQQLSQERLKELERTIAELERRRAFLKDRMVFQSRSIRQMLGDLDHATDRMMPMAGNTPELERIEGPRRKALQLLVTRGLHEIEALKIDLADSDLLSQKISDEQAQLNYLVHDLEEQRAMLELNRQLQVDVLQKKFDERLAQLENYRKLKSAEQQVEGMIQDFNARKELQKNMENDRLSEKMAQSQFAKLKGKLGLPVEGRILSQFGRNLDLKTKLTIFKKGLEIESGKNVPVKAISNGKVAFSGELPNYGRVTIVDHGDHFYSLVANLGELKRQVGDVIQSGDVLGQTDTQGTPVYFEIRARNIPVNPLQWVHN